MKPTSPATGQPFYGWRYKKRMLPGGKETLDELPLTLEDVLHPQEGDVIPEMPYHVQERLYLLAVMRTRPLGPEHVEATSDLLIDWGVPGMSNHSPDFGVFAGLSRPLGLNEGVLHLKALRGRCLQLVEIVSLSTRENDVIHKVDHYYRAGVPFYAIVDQESEGGPRRLRSFRRGRGKYREEGPDSQGRLALPLLGVSLILVDNRLICLDTITGQELGDYPKIAAELDQADQRIQEQAQELEQAIEQRRKAERRRQAAQRKAQREKLARQQAEKRIQELEEQIRKLGSSG